MTLTLGDTTFATRVEAYGRAVQVQSLARWPRVRSNCSAILICNQQVEHCFWCSVSSLPAALRPEDTDFTVDDDSSGTDDSSQRLGPGHDLEASPRIRSGGYQQLLSNVHVSIILSYTNSEIAPCPYYPCPIYNVTCREHKPNLLHLPSSQGP